MSVWVSDDIDSDVDPPSEATPGRPGAWSLPASGAPRRAQERLQRLQRSRSDLSMHGIDIT